MPVLGGRHLGLVVAGDDERRPDDLETVHRLARLGPTTRECGERHFAEVALGGEPVADESVADLAGDLGHQLADAGQEDLGTPNSVRSAAIRGEERGHQRVRVELASERQRRAVQPGVPDGAVWP